MSQLRTVYSPGAAVPFSGRGSGGDSSNLAANWAEASNGLVSYAQGYSLNGHVYAYGRPPYFTCAATGYRATCEVMVTVDGKQYIADFAPIPRDSMTGEFS
jgi:hypothetical protein